MLLELVHQLLVHIVFFPDKIFQTCLAVLLYELLSRPRFVIFFTFYVCFMPFCLFLFYFPSHHLLRVSFCFSLVVLSISRRGSLKRNQSVSIGVELRRKGVILSELQKS